MVHSNCRFIHPSKVKQAEEKVNFRKTIKIGEAAIRCETVNIHSWLSRNSQKWQSYKKPAL